MGKKGTREMNNEPVAWMVKGTPEAPYQSQHNIKKEY